MPSVLAATVNDCVPGLSDESRWTSRRQSVPVKAGSAGVMRSQRGAVRLPYRSHAKYEGEVVGTRCHAPAGVPACVHPADPLRSGSL